MKRFLLVLFLAGIFCLPEIAFSQVFADFENVSQGMQGFWYGWGNAGSNLRRIDDPTHGGVLALDLNVTSKVGDAAKAAIGGPDPLPLGWTDAKMGAYFLTFDVFVPADFPDSAQVKLWCQDKVNWTWNDIKYSALSSYGYKLVKGAWNTLTFSVQRTNQLNPKFLPWNCKGGLEFWFGAAGWAGTVFIDNATAWGVEPIVAADFENESQGMQGFWFGWGTAGSNLQRISDPTYGGVLSLDFNVTSKVGDAAKAAIGGPDPMPLAWTETKEGGALFTFDVFVPANFPDSAQVKLWSQDKVNWTWLDVKYSALSVWAAAPGFALKKGEWNTVAFPVKRSNQLNPKYVPWNCKGGLEFWFGAAGWSGKILIDNFKIHTKEVGMKWVYADFEKQSFGTYGFGNTGWNSAMTSIAWAADPSGQTAGVLKTDWNTVLDVKAQFVNENLDLKWKSATDTGATAMSIDVWVPTDIPAGTQLSIWATDKKSWSWTEKSFTISDSTVKPGKWNTLVYNVLDFPALDPVGVIRAGIQVFFSDRTWTGSIYFDNFTFIGIEKPSGALKSPAITASVDTTGNRAYVYNHIMWTDNEDNLSETYNVYMSMSPITNLTAPGVVRIGAKIPRGVLYWNHRPYSTFGVDQSYYYAVTATSTENVETEMTNDNHIGPVTVATTKSFKAVWDANFNFVIDGTLSEFAAYQDYTVLPEGAGVDQAGDWTPASTDLNFTANFVTNGKFLYVGANIIDDDLATTGQGWEGDAFELFMGFYDMKILTAWHDLGDIDAAGTGDYRIDFTSWGTTQKGGSSDFRYPGMTFLILPNPTGYLIEAKIELDSIGAAGWVPKSGDMLPFKIDCNDKDEVLDGAGTGRTKQINTAGVGNTENWKRPSCWGYLEFFTPSAVAEQISTLPKTTQLYANYPNPFNPTTTLKYDLAKNSHVSLVIYNMLGQKIRTLVDAVKPAGYHAAVWDGANDSGAAIASGIYFFEFKADGYAQTNKMILMK